MTETVILVDTEDREIGLEEKMAAHEQGLLHRAFSVFIWRQKDETLEVLLQQRHPEKYHCGGLWSNTCCSHPRPEENIIAAAQRRLQEEMGLSLSLQNIGHFTYEAKFDNGLTEHELDHVCVGQYDGSPIQINPQEVTDYRWMSITKLQPALITQSNQYTPWLKPALTMAVPYLPNRS